MGQRWSASPIRSVSGGRGSGDAYTDRGGGGGEGGEYLPNFLVNRKGAHEWRENNFDHREHAVYSREKNARTLLIREGGRQVNVSQETRDTSKETCDMSKETNEMCKRDQ